MNEPAGPGSLVIEPRKGWHFVDLRELWGYREVIFFLVWRDFKVRYRQTAIGIAWAVIQPMLTVGIFTILFSRLAKLPSDGVPYPLFALAGLVPWGFFSQGVTAATSGMTNNQDLVKRVYFPRLAIPLAAIFSGLADLAIGLLLLFGLLLFYGQRIGFGILFLPLFLILGMLAAIGLGLILSAANVRFRDVGHALPFALQIALLATPIAYPSSMLPEQWRLLYSLNPMVGVVDGVRWALFGTPIVPESLYVSIAATAVALIGGAYYFRHNERSLADLL
jgi:lipopolysaccharide transport system permease protein